MSLRLLKHLFVDKHQNPIGFRTTQKVKILKEGKFNNFAIFRVPTGPGKSCNFKKCFLGLKSPGILMQIMESPGNLY